MKNFTGLGANAQDRKELVCLRNSKKLLGWNIINEREMAQNKTAGLGRYQIRQALMVEDIFQSPKIENIKKTWT